MMLVGNVVCGWLMARSAMVAKKHLDSGSSDGFYVNKINTARYFAEHILPRSEGLSTIVQAGSASSMSIDVDSF
jgi:hypothetical protein